MKDFVSVDIDSTLSNDDVFEILSGGLPTFSWRRGDSDVQGLYVSGLDADGVKIQCWTGERPMAMSVSFRSAKGAKDEAKKRLMDQLLNEFLPRIGGVRRIDI